MSWTKRFYAKKCYFPPPGYVAPPIIGKKEFWGKRVASCAEAQVLASAGMDALVYLKTLRFNMEVFVLVTFFVSAVILPINLTGTEVDNLTGNPYDPSKISEYITFYLPDLNGTALNDTNAEEDKAVTVIEAPQIYNTSIPPPPPGLLWWERLPNIPPLPPVTVLGPEYENYTWIYDPNYKIVKYDLTALDKTTMTNIPPKSDRLYAHSIMTWWLTILVLWRLGVYCRQALNLRLLYFKNCPKGSETHTVLCTDIPGISRMENDDGEESGEFAKDESWLQKRMRQVSAKKGLLPEAKPQDQVDDDPDSLDRDVKVVLPDRYEEAAQKLQSSGESGEWLVREEFQALYKDEFVGAHLVYNTTKLAQICAQYEKTKENAYNSVDVALSNYMDEKKRAKMKKRMSTVTGATMGEWGREKYGLKPKKVDAFEFYVDRLEYLRAEILKEQESAKKKYHPASFVVFKTQKAQVVASQVMMSEDLSTWLCKPAPQPQEILWDNLRMRAHERNIRQKIFTISFWALMLFFMIPVTAVQVLISTNSLVGWLQTIPIASTLLTSILPGLALRLFLMFLPAILTLMLKKSGVISGSQMDLGLVSLLFIFQVITVFLGSFIAGTFANQFEQLIDDPGSIVSIFGTAAPQVGIFFMTYILVQACFEVPLSILDVVGLVIFRLKLLIAATKNAKTRLMKSKVTFDYGATIPDDSMVFLLGLAFSVACPLIAPIALIYFGTRYLVNKYNLVYRSEENYQSGGQSWLRVYNQYITGLVIFQILMVCGDVY